MILRILVTNGVLFHGRYKEMSAKQNTSSQTDVIYFGNVIKNDDKKITPNELDAMKE